ncbi:adenosine receptor A2a-like [Babylonia areolata]|uniref:adenosine receptor A2a-like n=1 Tax=Babylonia areolata TaxID=304850 RepID=UPI003FD2633D
MPHFAMVMLSLQLVFAFLIISSNMVIIVVFSRVRSLLRSMGKYLVVLAVVDLCTGLSVIYQCFFFFYPSLSTSKWMCLLRFQFIACLTLLSLVTLLQVSFERFLCITNAKMLACFRSGKRWYGLLSALWLYIFTIFVYPLVGANNWDGRTQCSFPLIMRGEQLLWMAITNWVVTAAMVCMYIRIWLVVRKKLSTVSVLPAESQTERSANSVSGEMLMFRYTLRSTKVAFVVTVMFTACWIPYSVVLFLLFLCPQDPTTNMVGDTLVFLGVSNSFMNPIIYTWFKQDFRRAFLKLVKCSR